MFWLYTTLIHQKAQRKKIFCLFYISIQNKLSGTACKIAVIIKGYREPAKCSSKFDIGEKMGKTICR